MKLSIVIPVFNEEKTILTVLKRLIALELPEIEKEIIVVNDGSVDKTLQKITQFIANNPTILLASHEKNYGKGKAIRTGIKKAHGRYILIQDADLEYHPKFIPLLLAPIIKKQSSVVYGTRLTKRPNFREDQRTFRFFIHYIGNKSLSLIFSLLYQQWLTDIETCYKLFPRKIIHDFNLESKGFEFEAEITAKLSKSKYKIHEVPIRTSPRGYQEGKKLNTVSDGFKTLWTILKYRFR
jgi:dolichol-phosphate mannosyltransferase